MFLFLGHDKTLASHDNAALLVVRCKDILAKKCMKCDSRVYSGLNFLVVLVDNCSIHDVQWVKSRHFNKEKFIPRDPLTFVDSLGGKVHYFREFFRDYI